MTPSTLLNPDGTASMATLILLAHHAFRRDLNRFSRALDVVDKEGRAAGLKEQWTFFQAALHGHHEREDQDIFPNVRGQAPELSAAIDTLSSQHVHIDPLLARGAAAFSDLPAARGDAVNVVQLLIGLLDAHLDLEEAEVVPHLRAATSFPVPQTDDEAALYAQGFAWTFDGIAPDVLDPVMRMLPVALNAKLPEARAVYAANCARTWGDAAAPLSSRASIPAT